MNPLVEVREIEEIKQKSDIEIYSIVITSLKDRAGCQEEIIGNYCSEAGVPYFAVRASGLFALSFVNLGMSVFEYSYEHKLVDEEPKTVKGVM